MMADVEMQTLAAAIRAESDAGVVTLGGGQGGMSAIIFKVIGHA